MDTGRVMKWFVCLLCRERSETKLSTEQRRRIRQTVRKEKTENE